MLYEVTAGKAIEDYAKGKDVRAIIPDIDSDDRQQLVPLGAALEDLLEGIRFLEDQEEPEMAGMEELPIRGLAKEIMDRIESEFEVEPETEVVFDDPIEMSDEDQESQEPEEQEETQTVVENACEAVENARAAGENAQAAGENAQAEEKKPKKAKKRKPNNTKIDDEEMIRLLREGKSQREIAAHFGTAVVTISNWIKRHKMGEENMPCQDCRFRTTNSAHGTCNYIGITGHMRGCSAVNCKKYEKGDPEPEREDDDYAFEEEVPEG